MRRTLDALLSATSCTLIVASSCLKIWPTCLRACLMCNTHKMAAQETGRLTSKIVTDTSFCYRQLQQLHLSGNWKDFYDPLRKPQFLSGNVWTVFPWTVSTSLLFFYSALLQTMNLHEPLRCCMIVFYCSIQISLKISSTSSIYL